MASQYLVHLPDGTEYGPVDRATLETWQAEGRLPEETLVWPEGAPEWLDVEQALAGHVSPPNAGAAAERTPRGGGPLRAARRASVRATLPVPSRKLLATATAVLVGVAVLWGVWALVHPWLARRYDMAMVQRYSTADRRVDDKDTGLTVSMPGGWVVLRADNPYVKAPKARLRLAQPALGAFATVSVAVRPRQMDALDQHLDELLQEHLPRQPSTKEAGRADVQLGKGRGRLVRTTWDDNLVPMQGAIVAWADGYEVFSLDAWGPAAGGPAFTTAVETLCQGLTPTGVLERRVGDAVERLSMRVPELSRDALRLLVSERMSQGLSLDDVPVTALRAVSRGLAGLAPQEAEEMRAIYQQVWAPVSEADRVRFAAVMQQLRAGREVAPADVLQVREALNTGVAALAPEQRARLQELSGSAVRKSLLQP